MSSSASQRECHGCSRYLFWVFPIQGSLFFHWSSVLGFDITEEVVSRQPLRDPKCVVFSRDPPEFYPTAPFSVKGDGVETLGGRGFCVVSNCFFNWYGVVRDCSPLYPSIDVSFRSSNPPFVESVRLEVPTVLGPLCQGVRFEDLGLNVTLVRSVTRLG